MSKKKRFFNQNSMTRVQVNEKVYTVTRMLPSTLLVTDPKYQRPLEMSRVKRIVDKFDPGLVNILKVSHRDGKYYVFDGGHTLAALKIIHEGEASFLVECKVYENLTFEEEARLFASQTGESRDVDFMYRIRALAVGRDPEILEFIRHTENAGFKLALGRTSEGCILALKKAKKVYDDYGADVYEDTLRLIRKTWKGEQQYLQANILGGVAVFIAAFGKAMLLKQKGWPDEYVFHNEKGWPLSQATFKRKWCELMLAAGCADWREVPEGTSRPGDILKQIKPRLTPHFFRHNYVTMLYESGVDPLIAMKIVGHTDYQTTANIYTHVRDEMLKKATVNMNEVFQQRKEE